MLTCIESLQYEYFHDDEDYKMCKDFTILNKFMAFLSSMHSFMPLKMTLMCKGYTTLITFIGFLSSMCCWFFGVFLVFFFFFGKDLFIYLFIYLFYAYKYTNIDLFRHTRRGHQTPLQMVVSHHAVAVY